MSQLLCNKRLLTKISKLLHIKKAEVKHHICGSFCLGLEAMFKKFFNVAEVPLETWV